MLEDFRYNFGDAAVMAGADLPGWLRVRMWNLCMKKMLVLAVLGAAGPLVAGCAQISGMAGGTGAVVAKARVLAWGDQGDGTYKNPILKADYSDPDIVRVGKDFYLVASDF